MTTYYQTIDNPVNTSDKLDREVRRLMNENEWDYETALHFITDSQADEFVALKEAYAKS